jgi:hypothetical protein
MPCLSKGPDGKTLGTSLGARTLGLLLTPRASYSSNKTQLVHYMTRPTRGFTWRHDLVMFNFLLPLRVTVSTLLTLIIPLASHEDGKPLVAIKTSLHSSRGESASSDDFV